MYSKFDEISFVGMSNSKLFFTERDQKDMEFKFMSRPKLEILDGCRNSDDRDELHQQEEEKKEEICEIIASSEELKIPSIEEFKVEDNGDDDDDGYHTPTSLDHKIPLIQQCPPAPRKPKSLLLTKRKASSNCHHLHIDHFTEIESLFPPTDLGCKIKKVRRNHTI